MANLSFPNETAAYRDARNALLDAEIDLRRRVEAVAAQRRALPPGGEIGQDYVFERIGAFGRPEQVRLSDLFDGKPSLMVYSFMYGPERDRPCPGCTHLIDGYDGAARHVPQVVPFYVVARSPLARLEALARARGWAHIRFLSDESGAYSRDYHGNSAGVSQEMRDQRGYKPGEDWDEPVMNVFRRDGDTVRHFWASELSYGLEDPGQHHRALDTVDPVWGLLDMIPEGRGDFFPKLTYD